MSYDYQVEDGGIQLKGTIYNDVVVGANGDVERLVVENSDIASNTSVIAGGTVLVLGGKVYETSLQADDARMDLISSDGKNFASAYQTRVTSNATFVVSSGCFASATALVDGGYMTVADFGSATAVSLGTGTVLYVNAGSVAREILVGNSATARFNANSNAGDIMVKDGGAAWFYSSVTLSGSLEIYGATRFLGGTVSATGLNVTMHLETHLPPSTTTITPFADASLDNFSGANLSLTLSNSQADGRYVLASNSTTFGGTITIKNMLGQALTTISLDQTKTISTGSYTLNIQDVALNPRYPTVTTKCLCLTVTTTPGNATWPYAWASAPINIKAITSSAFTFGSDSSYLTANGYAGSVGAGTFNTISGGTVTEDVYLNLNGSGSVARVVGGTGNNYVYLNNAGMVAHYIYGTYGTDGKSVNVVISQGKAAALVAAGQDTKIAGNVEIEFTSGNAATHTANIYGGVIGATETSSVEGNVDLVITGASLNGLVFAAGRAQDGSIASVAGDVNVTVSGATHTANSKITAGPTNWIVGGGMAVDGGSISVGGTVVINVSNSTVGYLVAGGMAQDQDSTAVVGKTNITISGVTTVTGSIYAGGYVANGGFSTVDESTIIINAAKGNTITIEGNIYAGSANPFRNGTTTVWDSTIVVGGSGTNLNFSGIVDGTVTNTPGSEEATSELVFSAFKGAFNGAIQNMDAISFTGNTAVDLTNGKATAENFVFDMSGRTKTNYGTSMADSDFMVSESSAIDIDFYTANLSSATTFALMDVLDEAIIGCATSIYKDGALLGSISFGESLTIEGQTFATKVENGVAKVVFTKA
ncbi:MAG: beta strand repeat-containing protein [Victivallaceae bacterium]|nr:hypothetical protein [Victivallaceae bacterium]